MDMISPKVQMCQDQKEKIMSARERNNQHVAEWFRDALIRLSKVPELEDTEGQSKKAMELTKGWISEWLRDLNLLRRVIFRSIILATINIFLNS